MTDGMTIEPKDSGSDVEDKDKKNIVIIDDDYEIVQSLSHAFESLGYKVASAYDGNAGLAMVETKEPDLVILDLMMPKRSGFLVLERLRQSEQKPCPVIMITANDGRRHQRYAEILGVNEYLHKPFTVDSLLKRVSELLDC